MPRLWERSLLARFLASLRSRAVFGPVVGGSRCPRGRESGPRISQRPRRDCSSSSASPSASACPGSGPPRPPTSCCSLRWWCSNSAAATGRASSS